MDNVNKNNYCVIMAGGIGSRFWPYSRTNKPKQFLDILGTGRSLIQQTYDRFKRVIPIENFLIVTNADYFDLVKEHLPELKDDQILLEPLRRNTAPCIAFANHKINQINPEANIIVAPSDHLIMNEIEFMRVVENGLKFVSENDTLLTLGIKPHRIETGYGYIQFDGDKNNIQVNETIRAVKTFTEKPDFDLAKVFFESGDFYWNSGIFFWSLKSIMGAFETHLSDLNNLFLSGTEKFNSSDEKAFIDEIYPKCKNVSIDYGIMEKAENAHVICSEFGWSDLGTWGSLHENLAKDENNNAYSNEKQTLMYDSKNCLVRVSKDKLAVVQGLDGYIVVESDNVLLICKQEDEQKIKQFVNDVKLVNPEYV